MASAASREALVQSESRGMVGLQSFGSRCASPPRAYSKSRHASRTAANASSRSTNRPRLPWPGCLSGVRAREDQGCGLSGLYHPGPHRRSRHDVEQPGRVKLRAGRAIDPPQSTRRTWVSGLQVAPVRAHAGVGNVWPMIDMTALSALSCTWMQVRYEDLEFRCDGYGSLVTHPGQARDSAQ